MGDGGGVERENIASAIIDRGHCLWLFPPHNSLLSGSEHPYCGSIKAKHLPLTIKIGQLFWGWEKQSFIKQKQQICAILGQKTATTEANLSRVFKEMEIDALSRGA